MQYLIDIDKSSGYFKIKIANEIHKINIKDMKEDSPLLLAVDNSDNNENKLITLDKTGFEFIVLEKNMNIVHKNIILQDNKNYINCKNKKNENNICNSKIIEESIINFLFKYYPEDKNIKGTISNELFEFAKKSGDLYDKYHCELYYKFVNIFNKYVMKNLISKKELFVICCVPSHDECNIINNTMSFVIRSLKQRYDDNIFIDGSDVLHRKYKIEKSSLNNSARSLEKQYNSLVVKKQELIKNKKILLIDDFYTTGSSINACKKILYENGASKVLLFAFGKTRKKVKFYE